MLTFLRENGRWIAGGFLLTLASSVGQTFFIAASVAEWQAKFDLSHGEFAGLYFIATLASAALLPWLGKLVDVAPEARVVAICVPCLAGAGLLAAYAPSIWVLTAALLMLRLFGQGMMTHIALTVTGRWFAAQRGRAVSLVVLGHQAGEGALPMLAASVTLAVGWQVSWVAAAAALVFIALPFAVWAYRVPRIPRGQPEQGMVTGRQWTRAEVIRDPLFYALLVGVLAPPFIGTILFFHQDYLIILRDWPADIFAKGLMLKAVITVAIALLTGSAVDRWGAVRLLPILLVPLALASLSAGLIDARAGLYLCMALLGVSYGISSTLLGALWPEVYGTKHLGAIRSLIVSAMVFATAAGPGLTGVLIDVGVELPDQLLVMSGYCVVATLGMVWVSRRLRYRADVAAGA